MSDLTEAEIWACLKSNLKDAATHCEMLATVPKQSPIYSALRQELKLVEGACRQMAHWREDCRWLPVGICMEEAHQRIGNWIRMHNPRPYFRALAQNLRMAHAACESLATAATGRKGAILPANTRGGSLILPKGLG
jgi:hypothetical protein